MKPAPAWERTPFAVVDGGLSTALEELGHHSSGLLWTAQLVLERPEVVVAAHESFVAAGADVVISSSYQASEDGFVRAGCDRAAARAALRSTTELARRSGASVVASSIGPYGATLGDGSEYHGRYEASWDEVRSFHRRRIEVLADSGPDLFAVETIPGRVEAEIVVEEIHRVSDLPLWTTWSCSDGHSTCAGDPFEDAVLAVVGSPGVIAVGVNCTDPRFVGSLLDLARTVTDRPLVAYPNHGRSWDAASECWIGEGPDDLVALVPGWVDAGARLIGGCCGIGPAGIARVAEVRDH